MMNEKERASYNFERLYNPSKQNFNLVERRNKNKKVLENIIDKYRNVEKTYAEEKRRIVLKIQADDTIKDKDKALDEAFEFANRVIDLDKKAALKELKDTIKKQAKYLLILKDPKMVYEYYKLISENPLEDEYDSLESELYREFLMRHPAIENIIVSYSALEDENGITNADPSDDRKDDPADKEKIEEAKKAVEKVEKSIAENNFDPAEFVDAYNKVNALKDGKTKEELLKRLDAITKRLADCLDVHLKDIEKAVINNISDVDKIEYRKINSVVSLFDFLVKYARNFDEITFGQRVETVVNKYNMQQQNTYKLTKEEGPVKQFGFWAKMRQLRPFLISRKDYRLKVYKKALVNSNSAEEKKEAIEGIKQIDVVNGVRLFMARNKLNKLKEKLRVSGTSSLDEEEQKEYDKAVNTISARIINELECSMEETAGDKIRVKTVIGQLLEVLSICPDKIEVSNVFGKVQEVYNRDDIFDKTYKYIRKAYRKGSLTEQEYKAYRDEINNIALYRSNVDDYYEVPSVSVNGEEEYSELDNETKKYYENPVKYSDENKIETDISYVRK